MPDPSDKVMEPGADAASSDDGQSKKTCADCGTSKTPLWRGGPAGPKSLCNACGIRSRKKRRVIVGLNKGSEEIKKPKKSGLNPNRNNNNNSVSSQSKLGGDPWKRRLLGFGREIEERQRRRKLGEVEQAAALLMALSYGSVYA